MAEPFLLVTEQLIPAPIDRVFAFFSQAENLQQITPPWLHFHIRSVDPSPIRQGTLIRYSLRWRVFPIRWTTEIVEWEPPWRFVDVQLSGPYRLWRHEHRFAETAQGTLIRDEVQYSLPLGVLGRLMHRLRVRDDVSAIFDYRKTAVERIFAERAASPA